MSNTKVFYIGAKAVKRDNVLHRKHLSWPGFGAVQTVPAEDAEVYFRYPTVWVDEKTFKDIVAKRKKAQLSRVVQSDPSPVVPDNGGSAEPDAPKDAAPAPETGATDTGQSPEETGAAAGDQKSAKPVGQSHDTSTLIPDPGSDDREKLVAGAILSLRRDDPKDYTTQGRPRVDRIVEIVGTNVSADEIDAAFKRLKHDGKIT